MRTYTPEPQGFRGRRELPLEPWRQVTDPRLRRDPLSFEQAVALGRQVSTIPNEVSNWDLSLSTLDFSVVGKIYIFFTLSLSLSKPINQSLKINQKKSYPPSSLQKKNQPLSKKKRICVCVWEPKKSSFLMIRCENWSILLMLSKAERSVFCQVVVTGCCPVPGSNAMCQMGTTTSRNDNKHHLLLLRHHRQLSLPDQDPRQI